VEVGARDGLQNETAPVPIDAKVDFVNALSHTGVDEIEVSAFVSPRWVPQLGDAEEVLSRISRRQNVVYNAGLPVRGYVSTAFWCAFEGKIALEAAVDVVERLVDLGVEEVSISDTIGKASPDEVTRLLDLLLPRLSSDRIAVHFHDTYGRGVENVLASWSYGLRIFDASVGGLGGCPYAQGATGNVATEAVVKALEGEGAAVGVDLRGLAQARHLLDPFLMDDRRTLPKDGSPACAACEFSKGATCCSRG